MKHFIITVDTEGDNLWNYHDGEEVQTENTLFIPRFQELCEKYGFKPVYLTNYEMICDDRFVSYVKEKVNAGLCEVGIHVHAWNNPPDYSLERKYDGNPYLIEYPVDVMRKKFDVTYNLIKERIGKAPVSHRAGRWAMNETYFRILQEYDVKIDCSFTPGVSWENNVGATISGGSDYSQERCVVKKVENIMEVPVTIGVLRTGGRTLKQKIKYLLKGHQVWLRPTTTGLSDMKKLVDKMNGEPYLEFMIHSSELMPAGSPYFKDAESIESLYSDMEGFFKYLKSKNYIGSTLKDFYNVC